MFDLCRSSGPEVGYTFGLVWGQNDSVQWLQRMGGWGGVGRGREGVEKGKQRQEISAMINC